MTPFRLAIADGEDEGVVLVAAMKDSKLVLGGMLYAVPVFVSEFLWRR